MVPTFSFIAPYAVAGDNSTFMKVSGSGSKLEIIAGPFKPVKIFIVE